MIIAQQAPPPGEEGLTFQLLFGGGLLAVMLLILWRAGVLSRRAFAEAPSRRGEMGVSDLLIAVGLWFLAQVAVGLVAGLASGGPGANGGGPGEANGGLGEAERTLIRMGLSQLLMLVPVAYVLYRGATAVAGGLTGFGLGLPGGGRGGPRRAGASNDTEPRAGEASHEEAAGLDGPPDRPDGAAPGPSTPRGPAEDPVRGVLRIGRWILLGSLAVLPLVFAVGMVVTVIATLLGDRPPAIAHGALRVLAETPPGPVLWGLIASAVLVAPLLEEILFRGLLQTSLLQTGFFRSRWGVLVAASVLFTLVHLAALRVPAEQTGPRQESGPQQSLALIDGQAQAQAQSEISSPEAESRDDAPDPSSETAPEGEPAPDERSGQRGDEAAETPDAEAQGESRLAWQALPVLFILSVGLGYSYERTGSLWVPIGIHAVFNGVQVLIVFSPLPAGG